MAERSVVWKILADFASVTRESRKAQQSMDRLEAKQDEFNTTAGATPGVLDRSTAAHARSTQSTGLFTRAMTAAIRAMDDRLQRDREAARASTLYTQAQTNGSNLIAKASAGVEKARRAEEEASGKAMLAAMRLDEVRKKGKATESALLSAEQRLAKARTEHAAATAGLRDAEAGLEGTTQGVVRGLKGLEDVLVGLGSKTAEGRDALANMRDELGQTEQKSKKAASGVGVLGVALKGLLVGAVISGIQGLSAAIGPLTAAVTGLVGALAPVSGLLGALPGLLVGGVGAVGTLIAGFSGIRGALKAYTTQQKASKTAAAQAATNDKVVARQQVQNTRAVRNAKEGLAAAYQQAGDSARQSSRNIISAERGVADAQYNAKQAQLAVSQARKDAKQHIDDLRKSLKDLALQEEGDSQSLEEARQRLIQVNNDPGSTDLQRREAATAVKQAQASLDDVKTQQKTNRKDLKDAEKKGIEGSDQVVQAKHAEAQANQAVADAEQQLGDARRESGRAAAASAKQIRDAKEALSDARLATSDLTAEQRSAAKASDVFAASLKGLSPAALAVVNQLIAMKHYVDELRKTAQTNLLPGVLSFLVYSTRLFPTVNGFIGKTARVLGNFFARVGKGISSETGIKTLGKIFDDATKNIKTFTDIAYNVGVVVGRITLAARGLTGWLLQTAKGWTQTWLAMTKGEAGQTRLKRFFTDAQRVASQLGRIIANVAVALYGVSRGTANIGRDILRSLENMTKGWADFTQSVNGKNAIVEFGNRAKPVLAELHTVLGTLFQTALHLGDNFDLTGVLTQINDKLIPAVKNLSDSFTGDFAKNLIGAVTGILDSGVLTTLSQGIQGVVAIVNGLVNLDFGGFKVGAGLIETLVGAIIGLKVAAVTSIILDGLTAATGRLGLVSEATTGKMTGLSAVLGRQGKLFGRTAKEAEGAATGLGAAEGGAAGAATATGGLGLALGSIIATFAAVAAGVYLIHRRITDYNSAVADSTQSLKDNKGALDQQQIDLIKQRLLQDKAIANGKLLGLTQDDITRASLGQADAWNKVQAAIKQTNPDGTQRLFGAQSKAASELAGTVGDLKNHYVDSYQAYQQWAKDNGIVITGLQDQQTNADSLNKSLDATYGSTTDVSGATGDLGKVQKTAAEKQQDLTNAVGAANDAYQSQINLINDVRDAQLAAVDSARALQGSQQDLQDLLKNKKKTAAGTNAKTQQGQQNFQTLEKFGTDARDNAISQIKGGKDPKKVIADLKAEEAQFKSAAKALHLGKAETDALVTALFSIPTDVKSTAEVDTEQAKADIQTYKTSLKELPPVVQSFARVKDETAAGLLDAENRLKTFQSAPHSVKMLIEAQDNTPAGLKKVNHAIKVWNDLSKKDRKAVIEAGVELDLTTKSAKEIAAEAQDILNGKKASSKAHANNQKGQATNPAVGGLTRPGFAEGGEIHGPGTTTSDSIPALLSDREFVHNAKATDYYGTGVMHALNQRKIDRSIFQRGRYARGGLVARRNRLAKGGQAAAGGSGGGATIMIKAGVDFSGLASAAADAAKVLAPLSGYLSRIASTVTSMGSRVTSAAGAVRSFGSVMGRVFGAASALMTAPFVAAAKNIAGRIGSIRATVVNGVNAAAGLIRSIWTTKVNGYFVDPFKPIPGQISNILNQVRGQVTNWVGKIGQAWSALKSAAAKPIVYIIDTVINGGLIAAYNSVAKNLGLKSIGNVTKPKGLSEGGQVPTVQKMGLQSAAVGGRIAGGPGRGSGTADKVLGVDRLSKMPTALVSPGEFVVPEKQTKKFFPLLERMRRGSLDSHAAGGTVRDLPRFRSGGLLRRRAGGLLPDTSTPIHFDSSNPSVPDAAQRADAVGADIPNNLKRVILAGAAKADGGEGASPGSAVSYGASHVGDMGWYRLCLRFVNLAWNRSVGRFGKATAQQSALAGPASTKGVPPAGAAVYWLGGSGHVALAKGDGTVYSNDILKAGRIDHVKQSLIDSKWHKKYRGWWSPNGANANSGSIGDGSAVALVDYYKKFTDASAKAVGNLKDAVFDSPFGQLAATAGQKIYDAMASKVKKANDAQSAGSGVGPSGGGGSNRTIGHRMMLAAGFSEGNWGPLERLWTRESGWNEHAKNPSSGAYGIPQSLPGNKMASAGSDWRDNPATQIKWGLGYIKGRYKNPSGAWAHSQKTGWYARGTNSAGQGRAVVGENGPEVIHLRGGERITNNTTARATGMLPRFYTGGLVGTPAEGFGPGASGKGKSNAIKAIQSRLHMKTSGSWDGTLSNALLAHDATITEPASALSSGVLKKIISWLKKRKKAFSLATIGSAVGSDPTALWREDKDVLAGLKKAKVASGKQSLWTKSTKAWGKDETTWRKALEKILGVKQDGLWTDSAIGGAVKHLLTHGMDWAVGTHGHHEFDDAPWLKADKDRDAIWASEREQQRSNDLNAEFDSIVKIFDAWNLPYLVRKMNDLGVADGLTTGRLYEKNKDQATTYNGLLQTQYERDDSANGSTGTSTASQVSAVIRAVGAGTDTAPVGLQAAASALSLSMDTVASLFDTVIADARWGALPSSKRGRFEDDVLRFRNLFKFQSGGRVPGHGNGDRMHILAEPGEFVLRRAAVSALGPEVMGALNHAEKFANGGFVAGGLGLPSYSAPSLPGALRSSTGTSSTSNRSVVNTFNTTIHNPTVEEGAVSVQKRVTRLAALGLLGDR